MAQGARMRGRGWALGAALIGLAAPALADTQAGVAAWEAGDYERAVREWEGPAAAGDADAQFNLAQAYRMGRGVPEDAAIAEDLYAASAAQGNLRAADNYGILLYLRGEHEAAIPLVIEAGARGDPRAQYLLGTAYFNGDPLPRDWPRAYAYMTLASNAGLPQAKEALVAMEGHLSPADHEKAAGLIRTLGGSAQGNRLASAPRTASAVPATAPDASVAAAPPPRREARPAPDASTRAPVRQAASGPWRVQLGSFAVAGNAARMWTKVKGRPELAGRRPLEQRRGKLTVLYATGFATQAEAQRTCRALSQREIDCLVTR